MRFNPKARLDRSQVQVRKGGGGRTSGGGFPLPAGGGGGLKVGGGIGGLLVIGIIIVFQLMGGGGGGGTGGFQFPTAPGVDDVTREGVEGLERCRTGADAQEDRQCAMLASVNSIQAFWTAALPEYADRPYQPALTTFFSGSVSSGCGAASSAMGPFYCPADRGVYLDTTFFRDMLEGRLGASGGEFAEAYVLAHEYGHHIQNLTGFLGRVRTQQGAESDAVRLELQADCLAGMWAKYAESVENADGEVYIEDLTRDDIARALDAAEAVGDDRIQQSSGARVNRETWSHGSSAARVYWFERGRSIGGDDGTLGACDTFAATDLHLDG